MTKSTAKAQTEAHLDYEKGIADWFVDLSEACLHAKNHDDALNYLFLAADILCKQNRDLTSFRIEENLRAIAASLPETNVQSQRYPNGPQHKPVCLHVLNEAMAFGGHTAMATRWIQQDSDNHVHSLALTSQQTVPSVELIRTVVENGGEVYTADLKLTFFQRAIWLRDLAHRTASLVVLHLDNRDVIAAIAFGLAGGPPVFLVNHAAHVFWIGSSIADVVINCRGSELERFWTMHYRGAVNCATIPIPLPVPDPSTFSENDILHRRLEAKELMGLPADSVVILTVGASFKYLPLGVINFLETVENILKMVPNAWVLAAGVIEDDRWSEVSHRLGYRLRAIGSIPQSQLAVLHQASDIYIEGFPFGSTTALLEAGIKSLPVVLAPANCPPPFGSDGVALDETLVRPATIDDYKNEVVRLCRNPVERTTIGIKLRSAILTHHTGAGWKNYLANAIIALPAAHCVYPKPNSCRTEAAIYEYWHDFREAWAPTRKVILEDWILTALVSGLTPHITETIKAICKRAKHLRTGRTIPICVLAFLCNHLLPLVPQRYRLNLFRVIAFSPRGALWNRTRDKLIRRFRRSTVVDNPFDQYRQVIERPLWFGPLVRQRSTERNVQV